MFYIFSDSSRFLTLEFFSPNGPDADISCLVAHGDKTTMELVLEYPVKQFPEWKWELPPSQDWPPKAY